jgi:glycerate dehydrogenase
MKIVVLDGYTLNPGDLSWAGLESFGELTAYDRTKPEEVLERIAGCEIVFTNKTPLTGKTIRALKETRYIGVLATGYNVVDIEAAKESGITVTNVPTYGTNAVAQMVFAHLLEVCHHVWRHNELVKKGEWIKRGDFCFWDYPLIELAGKTMGIIGYGRIGRTVSKIARAFGMHVLVVDPDPDYDQADIQFVDFNRLFMDSDIISLHCPLTDYTEGIINNENISRMKDGVILINTSRGQLVVEQDLARALNNGKIAAAGLDVLSSEPPSGDNPLLSAKNCILTPHIAWAPKESRERLMDIAVENLKSFLEGKPVNVVS